MQDTLFLLDGLYKRHKILNNYFYALDNINLTIKRNSIILIKGSIGSGKTTLLNIISLLDNNYKGDVYYNRININFYKEKEKNKIRSNEIGIVFQDFNLLPNLNVYQNIKLGNKKIKANKEIKKIIKLLDLEKILDKKINEISGGERQRTSIARCLIKTKDVLILDEPTSALDKSNCLKIISILKNINDIYKTTIIIATHDDRIDAIADEIIKIENGKILKN